MFRQPHLPCLFFLAFLLQPPAPAQQPLAPINAPGQSPGDDKQSATARQSAMNMLEEVLAGTGSLALPQNRLAIELQAFPVVYSRSEARARALINQMAGEFAQAASPKGESNEEDPRSVREKLREQRTAMARAIALEDAEMALFFLSATLPYIQSNLPDDDSEDHALLVDLAAQVALHDPRRALQLAEQQLKECASLPPSFIELLDQVERNDAQAGARLFRDVVDHIKQQNFSDEPEQLSFAVSLLASQYFRQSENGGPPDSTLRALAEIIATSALSSNILRDQPYALNSAWDALRALVPAQSAALQPKVPEFVRTIPPETTFWKDFSLARGAGDADKLVAMIAQMPGDNRDRTVQQVAWEFAGTGDVQKTRQIADILDPWQRNNIIQQAIHAAAALAASKGDFAGARLLAGQITDENSRARLLGDLAIYANGSGQRRLAEEMLGEAASLVVNHTAGISAFTAQLSIAQAYLRVNPAQAVPLLEHSASQLEQALSAAAQLDGFLPDQHSFAGSELILDHGFLYQSLIQPYAMATAELATVDLPAARTLADRVPLPEARLMTELFVARGVLEERNDAQTTKHLPADSHALVWLGSDRFVQPY